MTPRRILATYFAIAGLYTLSAALIWGVNTLFLLDAGLDIFGVFVANAAFAAGMFVFEIPTGVLADTAGRRVSFLLSVAILALTTVGYVAVARFGGGLGAFAAVSVLIGLGFTFYSGAVEAWLVDALSAAGFEGELDSVFARGSMVSGGAMLLGTLTGGVLGSIDLAVPYVARAFMLVVVFVVAFFTMQDLGFTPRTVRVRELPNEMRAVAAASVRYGWHQRPVRLLMLCSFVQYGFMAWAIYAWQPYFLELLGRDAVWVAGVVASLMAASMIAGNAMADWFSSFCGKRTTLLLWAAGVQTVAAVGVGLASSFTVAVAFFMVMTGAVGAAGRVKQAFLQNSIPSEQRASITSFASMFGNGGGVLQQAGLGYLARVRSIGEGYVIGGAFTLVAQILLWRLRFLGADTDIIVGRRGGARGSCPAQGIPEIALVDARRTL
jgi:MFS family permease